MGWNSETPHQSVDERKAYGKSLRESTPRSSHAVWSPTPSRPDPVALIESQNEGRLQWLVPVRRGRMVESAFTFYRGAGSFKAEPRQIGVSLNRHKKWRRSRHPPLAVKTRQSLCVCNPVNKHLICRRQNAHVRIGDGFKGVEAVRPYEELSGGLFDRDSDIRDHNQM